MKALFILLVAGCTLPFVIVGFLVSMVIGSFMAGVRLEHLLKDWAGDEWEPCDTSTNGP